MAIIGGTIQPKKTTTHTHRITFRSHSGERSTIQFHTIRSARNWIREHATLEVFELVDLRTSTNCLLSE